MKAIELCDQIILAANTVAVQGEQNMVQLLGIARAARAIKAELNEQAKEACGNG